MRGDLHRALLVAVLLTGCGDIPTPTYRVVEDTTRGIQRYILVEVDSADGLRAVFDAVLDERAGDGGYFVTIDCSTGGTVGFANRLANGRASRGLKGKLATGLEPGEVEFEVNADRACPAT